MFLRPKSMVLNFVLNLFHKSYYKIKLLLFSILKIEIFKKSENNKSSVFSLTEEIYIFKTKLFFELCLGN